MLKKSALFHILFLIAIAAGVLNTGCANLDRALGREPKEIIVEGEPAVRYSENNNLANVNNRNYKRMTRERLEEESELNAQAGSMWVMEGQGAYLFAQNKMRREGDLLNVNIEGPAQKQVEMKVNVIKTLLKQLDDEEAKANPPAGLAKDGADGQKPPADPAAAAADRAPASAAAGADAKKDEGSTADAVKMVPTRIVEKLADGNYRVKGQQPFMIGQREYKVIVTGVIRPEEFNDGGISSNKLLDPQFDVVSIRKKDKVI